MPITLSSVAEEYGQIEKGIREIFWEKGVIQKPDPSLIVPEHLTTYRSCVAAVIVPDNWRDYIDNPYDLPIGLGANAQKPVMEIIGGGIESTEERALKDLFRTSPWMLSSETRAIIKQHLGEDATELPQWTWFMMQGAELLHRGRFLDHSYRSKFDVQRFLELDLGRELSEEIGDQARKILKVVDLIDAKPFQTELTQGMTFGKMNADIAKKLADEGVTLLENGKLKGVKVVIDERGLLLSGDLDQLIELAENTEELRGVVKISIGDLLARGEIAIADGQESWNNFDTEQHGLKPRNNSLYHLVKELLLYLSRQAS